MARSEAGIKIRAREDDRWKERSNCRTAVLGYMRLGWAYERAQRHVTDLYYMPGDGLKPGRQPAGGRTVEEDSFFLPRLWCSTCPVRDECLDEVVRTGDAHGFRAGFTPNEMQRIVKVRRRERLREDLGAQRLSVNEPR